MQQFLRLVDTIQRNGIIGLAAPGQPARFVPDKEVLDAIESCTPFVFSELPEDHGFEKLPDVETFGTVEYELDAPFKVFSIECLEPEQPVVYAEALDHEDKPVKVKIWCILVREISPKEYLYLTLMSGYGNELQVSASNNEGPIVAKYLNLLARHRTGVESVRVSMKIGQGKNKRHYRLRRVIHVCPKSQIEKRYTGTKSVDWSHRFEVRGHWRKLDGGLGKDREGNYCVSGFTWVTHHIRGPEHLPLVKKVRVIDKLE